MSDAIAPPSAAAAAPAAAAPAAAPAVAAAPPPAPRTRVVAPAMQRPAAVAPVAAAPIAAAAPTEPAAESPKARAQVPARVAAELADLRQRDKSARANTEALAGYANTALAELPADLAAFIRETVGEDPAAQLRAVTNAKAKKLAAPAGMAPGATTAPAASPAAAPESLNDNDVKAARHYQKLMDDGKPAATTWMAMHGAAIERGLKKIAGTARTN